VRTQYLVLEFLEKFALDKARYTFKKSLVKIRILTRSQRNRRWSWHTRPSRCRRQSSHRSKSSWARQWRGLPERKLIGDF